MSRMYKFLPSEIKELDGARMGSWQERTFCEHGLKGDWVACYVLDFEIKRGLGVREDDAESSRILHAMKLDSSKIDRIYNYPCPCRHRNRVHYLSTRAILKHQPIRAERWLDFRLVQLSSPANSILAQAHFKNPTALFLASSAFSSLVHAHPAIIVCSWLRLPFCLPTYFLGLESSFRRLLQPYRSHEVRMTQIQPGAKICSCMWSSGLILEEGRKCGFGWPEGLVTGRIVVDRVSVGMQVSSMFWEASGLGREDLSSRMCRCVHSCRIGDEIEIHVSQFLDLFRFD